MTSVTARESLVPNLHLHPGEQGAGDMRNRGDGVPRPPGPSVDTASLTNYAEREESQLFPQFVHVFLQRSFRCL